MNKCHEGNAMSIQKMCVGIMSSDLGIRLQAVCVDQSVQTLLMPNEE